MGFFRRKKEQQPPLPTRPALAAVAPAPVAYSPPPYSDYQPPPIQNIYQHYEAQDDGFISMQDFNAIQQAIDQQDITDQFSEIIANIDEDRWNDADDDLAITIKEEPTDDGAHLQETARAVGPPNSKRSHRRPCQVQQQKITIWSKVSYYSNSRLPTNLPPLRVYIPTWPLICLAAQYSRNAYTSPMSSEERKAFVSADARLGTKAMVMKSIPCDDKKTLVFAIRGTSALSLRDWNVNLHTSAVSPTGFLDDEGNLCHAGFLRVAKAMINPIAMRLRSLLEENPSRARCSLLITGHSAGGAVAALLFTHMLSTVKSELSNLTGCFKRVHCVTFGAPPVSLLPLAKPADKRFEKSLFFSFMNEGDPVVRAEKAYIRSLVDLLSTPVQGLPAPMKIPRTQKSLACIQQSVSKLDLSLSKVDLSEFSAMKLNSLKPKHSRATLSEPTISFNATSSKPPLDQRMWPVPTATLSNAGRLVVMRVPHQARPEARRGSNLQRTTSNRWEKNNLSQVTAQIVTDDELRQVIFGDPSMHAMEVYLRRVDMLALKAVTARG